MFPFGISAPFYHQFLSDNFTLSCFTAVFLEHSVPSHLYALWKSPTLSLLTYVVLFRKHHLLWTAKHVLILIDFVFYILLA